MNVFERYAPFIQDYIYRCGWQNLRGVQNAAGEAIFGTEENVLLTASTASGKTEAAFFPILTLLNENPSRTVGVLYIAPLKALINDQFGRLNELCEEEDIAVYRWHGDVAQTRKRKLLRKPSGILQITPESLESLMINKHMEIPSLFGDLRFIVIDEIHSLMRADRGLQTFCLIERMCALAGCSPRRIGLSATIGNPEAAGQFLAAGSGRGTVIPKIGGGKEVWRLSMEHFYNQAPQADEGKTITVKTPPPEPVTDRAPEAADPGIGYIFEHTAGKKCLIFTNSREECEAVCQNLRQYCEVKREPDRFLIHHGNLSASYRESAEEEMKDDDSLLSVCATATLELGIDIGRLERAFQIDAPFTVSGFLQRMGRTGRRGAPSEMWFVMREDHTEARAMLPDSIPWYLIQGIALIQLYIEERFVEPPRTDRLPYSLLYHQTMSTLASCGEMTPGELASRVLPLSSFSRISQDDYRQLLLHLIGIDHINRTENGGLIVGLAGCSFSGKCRIHGPRGFRTAGDNRQAAACRRQNCDSRPGLGCGRSGSQEPQCILYPGQGQYPRLFWRCGRRYPHPHTRAHARGAVGRQPLSLPDASRSVPARRRAGHIPQIPDVGAAPCPPRRQHVGALPLAWQLRFSGPGALPENPLQEKARAERAERITAILYAVYDAGERAGILRHPLRGSRNRN